ncbi:IclR family transcriptional regulator [Halogeometricum limi]|uniref:Transcriptional regulator, IclR family n=1 Tax=Halogeometricum limi TaxID=555875 RepID=A0A1I6IBT9_9EURY|nr:IclR family transcriptional regulator [Halogeometricum limi]SFR64295.1 transcriptional regulator, IclR family [Halogeometricum limi]
MAAQGAIGRVKTTATVFEIVEALDELGDASLTELADHLGLAKSTAYDHLTTMVEHEYVVKDEKRYRLGLRFLKCGVNTKRNLQVSQLAQPVLNQLAEQTNEIAWLLVEEYGQGVYVNKAKGMFAVQAYGKMGTRVHLHNIAAGKAILAHLPEHRVREIIEQHGLPAQTENTITDPEELFEHLAEIRERGVAFQDCESMENFRAVASPVVADGRLHGSLVVSAPKNRMRAEKFREEVPDLVAGAANALELELLSQ